MGMGHAAAYADVIEQDSVKKICPVSYSEFLDALGGDDCDIEEFAMEYQFDSAEDFAPTAFETFGILQANFECDTGLGLGIAHHQSDECGDRYDEVDGTYFYVNGMYELSEGGKKLENLVQRKTFVQFG